MSSPLPANSHVGRYEIRSQLGVGGMGEVYLAWDTKLERKIALKILPADLASNKDRLRRFEQEAKAASALNHPNIITIYEIEQIDSINFIATELIEGQTLRERLRLESLKLAEILDLSIQVASALSAAHGSGIVHRDIKPENIMVRKDGIVKVLDFGLAKLIEEPSPDVVNPEAPTRPAIHTDPNVVMGTAIYMSPEQARGREIDARTDIFSLGVVLYEMVTGRLPFAGSTTSEVLASVLSDKEPQPLARYSREAPAELERIVAKSLRKDREQRYQTTKDLLLDLQNLKQQSDFESRLERSTPPDTREAPTAVSQIPATIGLQSPSTASISGSTTTSLKQHRLSLLIGLLILIFAASGLTYLWYSSTASTAIESIAVLPFINASNDANSEYLSDGITESIISNLSQLSQLKVMARSTVFHFKGKETDPREVGRQLGVQAVMSGRLLRQDDHLIVRTELVNVADGRQLWGGEYDRELSDVLGLQQDISREISDKLRLKLTGEEKKRLTGRNTTNAEAYEYYLRGRYFWNKRTGEGLTKAIEQFQQAIDRDPNYALGYVGLADSYALLEEYAGVPSSETLPKARAAADHALAIDNSLSEAHVSSGIIFQQMWRWSEAVEEYTRAISLNPNYPTAHHFLSIYFRTQGELDDSLREIKRAQELDPLSSVIGQNVAEIYLLKNDLSSAIAQCQRIIELDPNFPGAHDELGFAYLKEQRNDEAMAEFQKTVELSGRASRYLGDLGYAYAITGKRAEAQTILRELKDKYERSESIGQYVAAVYAGLGDKDQAFAWLERDFERQSGIRMPFLKWWFTFDGLRGDQRYNDLLHRVGLKP
jgi:eukaryotic-like serine/threonine-protein kinase